MKKSTLTAIIATAFSLAAFESVKAEGLLDDSSKNTTEEASECGGPNGCGKNNTGSSNTNSSPAGESTKINMPTSSAQ